MKFYIDKKDYIELKRGRIEGVDLSIRTEVDDKTFIITANLNEEHIEKMIAEMVQLKSRLLSAKI